MAKRNPCVMIANTAWGYCFQPQAFDSIRAAKKEGRWQVENGYAFHYRVFTIKNKQL